MTTIMTISPALSPSYSSAKTYAVGDFVLYDNEYRRCTTAITTPEAWNPAHWSECKDILGETIREIVQDAYDNGDETEYPQEA